MSQYNALNIKLSNSQFNNLKSGRKNRTEATLNLSSNLIGNSNDETNFPHKLLFTNTKVSRIRKFIVSGSSANIKLFLKTYLPNIAQLGGFLFDPSDLFDSPILPIKEITLLGNSILISLIKELMNTGSENINKDIEKGI